jgi:hypothetical protein
MSMEGEISLSTWKAFMRVSLWITVQCYGLGSIGGTEENNHARPLHLFQNCLRQY